MLALLRFTDYMQVAGHPFRSQGDGPRPGEDFRTLHVRRGSRPGRHPEPLRVDQQLSDVAFRCVFSSPATHWVNGRASVRTCDPLYSPADQVSASATRRSIGRSDEPRGAGHFTWSGCCEAAYFHQLEVGTLAAATSRAMTRSAILAAAPRHHDLPAAPCPASGLHAC